MGDFHRFEHRNHACPACCFREVHQNAVAGLNGVLGAAIKAVSMLRMEDPVQKAWVQQPRFLHMPEVTVSHVMNFTERSTTGIEISPSQADRAKIFFGEEAGGIGQGVGHTLVEARGIPCQRGPDLVKQFVYEKLPSPPCAAESSVGMKNAVTCSDVRPVIARSVMMTVCPRICRSVAALPVS